MADESRSNQPRTGSFSLRSVAGVTALSIAQLVLLFGLQLVLAHVFGASRNLDAYLAAYAIPLTIGGILSGAATSALVPIYQRRKAEADVAASESAAACVLAGLALASTAIALGLTFWADEVSLALYGDLTQARGDAGASVAKLLAMLAWLVPLNVMTGAYFGLEHARGRFLYPAAWGTVGPIVTLAAFLFASDRSIEALAWATLAGGAVGAAGLALRTPSPAGLLRTDAWLAFVSFASMVAPLLLGAAVARLDAVIDRPLAASLAEGSISHLGYAWRIVLAASTIATTGLSAVIFPSLARHASRSDEAELGRDLAEGWRFLCVVVTPIVLGIGICGKSIVAACFQRGEFTATDTERVATLSNLYLGALIAAACGELATRTFLAFGRTWIPTIIGISGFAIGVGIKFAVIDRFGADGLAGATSAYTLLNALVLVAAVAALRLPGSARGLATTALRSLSAAVASVGTGYLLMQFGTGFSAFAGVAVATVLYAAILYVAGDEFARRGATAARSIVGGRTR